MSSKCFGGRDPDFWSYSEVDACIRFARDGGSDDIDDAEREGAAVFRFVERREGVCGFTRLRYSDDDGAVLDERVSVAELARVLAFCRDFGEVFEEVLADHRGVKRGALCGEDDATGLNEFFREGVESAEHDLALVLVQSAFQAAAERFGLLVDLFEHVVLE